MKIIKIFLFNLSLLTILISSCNNNIQMKNDFSYVYVLEARNEGKKTSIGTCFYSNNIFYTNAHLITYKDLTDYLLYDDIIAKDETNNITYNLNILSYDLSNDYAALVSSSKIDGGLNIVKNYDFKIGEDIFTIGNLNNYGLAYGYGKVTSNEKVINNSNYNITYVQTNIEISGGNSGGPVFNINNEVIGIMSMKLVNNNEYVDGASFFVLIK